MRRYATASEGGCGLATSVRELAHQAHEVLGRPVSDRGDAIDVLREIDRLQTEYGENDSAPIRRWLENLRRQVERS